LGDDDSWRLSNDATHREIFNSTAAYFQRVTASVDR
jgi:hypothetical protein